MSNLPQSPVYLVLLHHPILDKQGNVISTAVTNLDIHDGARLAATYGLHNYFIVTPLHEQISLVVRVRGHWVGGPGGRKTPTRRQALEGLKAALSLEEVCEEIAQEHGERPLLIGTSARQSGQKMRSYAEVREAIHEKNQPIALLFGTGWGIAEAQLEPPIDFYLPPIVGPSEYNHLSVRAAMAITLDRLLAIV